MGRVMQVIFLFVSIRQTRKRILKLDLFQKFLTKDMLKKKETSIQLRHLPQVL